MRAVLIAEDRSVREMILFALSSKFNISAVEASSDAAALELIDRICVHQEALMTLQSANTNAQVTDLLSLEASADLVVMQYPNGGRPKVIEIIERKLPGTPIICFGDHEPNMNQLGRVKYVGFAKSENLIGDLEELTELWLQSSDHKLSLLELEKEYCPIKTTLLMRATPLKGDIFVRLSERKYIRLFSQGSAFETEDLEKYHEKKQIEYMYVRREEASFFMQAFQDDLKKMLEQPSVSVDEAEQVVTNAREAVAELIDRIGFTEEVQEIARASIDLAVKAMGENPQLGKILAKLKANRDNYSSGHSITLANVSCCIAATMDWVSKATYTKLAMAAFFHDIFLKNEELAQISTLEELQDRQSEFDGEDLKTFKDHPINAANLVKQFHEIPADVDMIIIQHHEHPGGSGFPRGLSDSQVGPLSCLFIVAHDMVHTMYREQEKFNAKKWLDRAKGKYSKGNYRKIITSMLEIEF